MDQKPQSSRGAASAHALRVAILLSVLCACLLSAGSDYSTSKDLDAQIELTALRQAIPANAEPAAAARYILLVADLRAELAAKVRYKMILAALMGVLAAVELARARRHSNEDRHGPA
jgi:hypothetical protein